MSADEGKGIPNSMNITSVVDYANRIRKVRRTSLWDRDRLGCRASCEQANRLGSSSVLSNSPSLSLSLSLYRTPAGDPDCGGEHLILRQGHFHTRHAERRGVDAAELLL